MLLRSAKGITTEESRERVHSVLNVDQGLREEDMSDDVVRVVGAQRCATPPVRL